MKLISLIEEDGQNGYPEIDTYNRLIDVLEGFINDKNYKRFDNELGGTYLLNYRLKLDPAKHLSQESYGSISVNFNFSIGLDNAVIPLELLSKPLDLMMTDLKNFEPKLVNNTQLYPIDLLNRINVIFDHGYIKIGSAMYDVEQLFGVSLHNIKVKGFSEGLGDMLLDPSKIEGAMFAPGTELPKLSDNYKAVHNRLIKRAKTIVNAFRTGTWRGHTYDLGKVGDADVFLLTDYNNPTIKNGVIQPSLQTHLRLSGFEIDGKKQYIHLDNKSPLTDKELSEFRDYLKKLLKKYNIDYQ